ncbi:MAG TPA: hypothetical protein VK217_10670, partial [Acidimicrobiales bacterium]|nr:hypothetical protein [Acidimicrobiales bacterium]
DGTHIWVSDSASNSVTEINPAGGSLDRIVSGSSYLFTDPSPVTVSVSPGRTLIYVASPPGSSPMVTAFSPSSGPADWAMCNTNGPYEFNNPQALLVTGGSLWVANTGGNSLTEMYATTGALIRRIS